MASNDMTSWDEDPDERLRRRWQQVFADFEIQARPSLSQRILDRLTPSPPRRRGRWLAIAALLLLISGGVVYQIYLRERSSLGRSHSATAKYTKPIQPPSAGRLRQPAAPIGRSVSPSLPMIDPLVGRSLTEWQPPVHPPIVSEVDTSQMSTTTPETPGGRAFGVAVLSERRAVTRPWPAERAQLLSRARVQVTLRPEKKVLLSKPARLFSSLFPVRTVGRSIITGPVLPSAPVERSGSHSYSPLATPHSSVIQPLSNALPTGWALLTPHGFSLLPSRLLTLPDQLPVISTRPLHQVGIVVTRQRWYWFVDAIPLSSFQ